MKKVLLQLVCCMLVGGIVQAQQAQMNYYAARQISGETSSQDASVSGTGTNYILLHEAYDGIEMPLDHFVMGKISAIRGSGAPNPAAWNLKMTLEVNTASAFQTNRANLVSYNETGYSIVKVMYNSKRYLAIKIPLGSSIFNLTFTGYAQNELFQLVWNIEPLNNGTQDIAATETPLLPSEFDDNTFSGDVGIGTNSPLHRLDVVTHNATQPSTDNNEIYSIADKGDAKIGLQNLNNTWSISSIGSWSTSNAGDLAITDETGRNIPIFIHKTSFIIHN